MLTALLALAAASPAIRPEFQPLAFLTGHCWRGTFQTANRTCIASSRFTVGRIYGTVMK
jgi:hypothetical protein